ncbi:MAG: hypothetical protein WAV51_02780 [Microgenomates group bacterium]
MEYILHLCLLVFYCISLFVFGWVIVKRWFGGLPTLLTGIASWLLGTVIGVPVTYLVSCLFAHTSEPILFGVAATTTISFISFMFLRNKEKIESKPLFISDILLVLFSIVFSSWMMMKTFHGEMFGVLYVGSNNVFDFSHALGIIRSFSYGSNIPFMSPFQSGLPFLYHFLFYFYVAIWEYLGVPIIWAMNIPSILSMTSLLVIIYYLPQLIFKQKPLVGWIAVLLSITNSTLTFWQIFIQKGISLTTIKSLWQLPTYPFAGPFDGSTISIFTTLNNYVNQRHLALAIAFGLFLFILVDTTIIQKRLTGWKMVFFGLLTGLLLYWNVFILCMTFVLIGGVLLVKKQWSYAGIFSMSVLIVSIVSCMPYLGVVQQMAPLVGLGVRNIQTWTAIEYLWQNIGLLPIGMIVGCFAIPKQRRNIALFFIFLFIIECAYAVMNHHGFDQKFYSFLILLVNCITAIGVVWLWEKKQILWKCVAVTGLSVLAISGVIDLIPIKNEFAYPLVDHKILPVITWMQTHTEKSAVFVSYSDMIDPVVLAGRKNYFGFFGNVGTTDRSSDVRQVYTGDLALTRKLGIMYILVPRWDKNDFPYRADTQYFEEHNMKVYEDERYSIYTTVIK